MWLMYFILMGLVNVSFFLTICAMCFLFISHYFDIDPRDTILGELIRELVFTSETMEEYNANRN